MSTSAVTINLNARFDPKPFKEAENAVDSLDSKARQSAQGRERLFRGDRAAAAAKLNLFRQGSDVFTQSMTGASPFTIAIQQGPQIVDILATGALSMGAIASSVVAIGGATAGVGYVVYKIKELIDAQKELAEVSDSVSKSFIKRAIEMETYGVTAAEAEGAKKILSNAGTQAAQSGDEALAKWFSKVRARIGTKELVDLGEQMAFDKRLDRKRLDEVRENEMRRREAYINNLFASGTTPEQFREKIGQQKSQLETVLRGPQTGASADEANRIMANIVDMRAVALDYEKRIEEMKQFGANLADVFKDFGQSFADKFKAYSKKEKKEEKEVRNPAFSQEIVSARQRIGGMANAPIFSDFRKQVEYLRFISETSKQTAQNTARQTPAPSVVSAPTMTL